MEKKVYNLLGLAQKAGNLVSGEGKVGDYIKKNKLHLVILAEDAEERTRKFFLQQFEKFNVAFLIFGTKVNLGSAIGKSPRVVIGILDKKFSEVLVKEVNSG